MCISKLGGGRAMTRKINDVGRQQRSTLSRRAFVKAGVLGSTGTDPQTSPLRAEDQLVRPDRGRPREKTPSSSCGCAAAPASTTCGIPSRTRPSKSAANSASFRRRSPASAPRHAADDRAHHGHSGRSSAACITDDAGHSAGDQICFTGYPAGRDPEHQRHPSCGSIVRRQLGT